MFHYLDELQIGANTLSSNYDRFFFWKFIFNYEDCSIDRDPRHHDFVTMGTKLQQNSTRKSIHYYLFSVRLLGRNNLSKTTTWLILMVQRVIYLLQSRNTIYIYISFYKQFKERSGHRNIKEKEKVRENLSRLCLDTFDCISPIGIDDLLILYIRFLIFFW